MNDTQTPMTSDEIIRHMELHEDSWEEIAFNGDGTGAMARMGKFTHYSDSNGVFRGTRHATDLHAHQHLVQYAAAFTNGEIWEHPHAF